MADRSARCPAAGRASGRPPPSTPRSRLRARCRSATPRCCSPSARSGIDPPTAAAPTRIAASRYKDFVADYAGTVAAHRATAARAAVPPDAARARSSTRGSSSAPGSVGHRRLARRRAVGDSTTTRRRPRRRARSRGARSRCSANFAALGVGDLQPIEVETEIDFTATRPRRPARTSSSASSTRSIRRDDRGGRIEIVDWKTGAPPRTDGRTRRADAAARAVSPGVPRASTACRSNRSTSRCTTSPTTSCCAADRELARV